MKNTKYTITIHNSLASLGDNPWKQRTERLEYDLALKWFAVTAYDEDSLASFMHMIRHPTRPYEWYFCDVYTMEPYRRQGIAAAMYGEAMHLLLKYRKACRITASVRQDNAASIRLHEKMGFSDTHQPPVFEGFDFEPGETVFEHYFVREYPARNVPIHQNILSSLAGEKAPGILAKLAAGEKLFIIWAGENAVGYRLEENSEAVLLPEWETHMENKCLTTLSFDALFILPGH